MSASSGATPDASRRSALAAALREVRGRIGRACADAGRDPLDVRLLAVTKAFPATDAALLADLGLDSLGENRDQEASAKVGEFARLRPGARVRWHMVGRMQRNKARSVVRWADEVQSVDSSRLADTLSRAVTAAVDEGTRSGPLDVLVQAGLDDKPGRGGCPLQDIPALAEKVRTSSGLRLRGLMAIAPLAEQPDVAFARLDDVVRQLRADHPAATELSLGMSGDLEAAIMHGSSCVRVGTALLGGRPLTSHPGTR